VGSLFTAALKEIPEARHFGEKSLLIDDLKKNPIANSTILVKASRGIGLESILDYL
jgi:UDP-N-acetylmuramoyl-tripeptide--D-alanyl-D-alanine ligase